MLFTVSFLIDFGKLTDWLTLVTSIFALIVNVTLLLVATRNIRIIRAQLKSQSYHQIIDSHRNLFLDIIKSDELLNAISDSNIDETRKTMLASVIINHASRIFNDFVNDIAHIGNKDSFLEDLVETFQIEIVSARWPQVRAYHNKDFRDYIEKEVIPKL